MTTASSNPTRQKSLEMKIELDTPCIPCTESIARLNKWMTQTKSERRNLGHIAVELCQHCVYAPVKNKAIKNNEATRQRLHTWTTFYDTLDKLTDQHGIDRREIKSSFKPLGVHNGRLYIMSNDTREYLRSQGIIDFDPKNIIKLSDDVKIWVCKDLAIVTSTRRNSETYYTKNGRGKKIEAYTMDAVHR